MSDCSVGAMRPGMMFYSSWHRHIPDLVLRITGTLPLTDSILSELWFPPSNCFFCHLSCLKKWHHYPSAEASTYDPYPSLFFPPPPPCPIHQQALLGPLSWHWLSWLYRLIYWNPSRLIDKLSLLRVPHWGPPSHNLSTPAPSMEPHLLSSSGV